MGDAFMKPHVTLEDFLVVEDKHGSTVGTFPADIANLSFRDENNKRIDEIEGEDTSDLQSLREFCEGEPAKVRIIRGKYWAQLSAPGYMDQTDWNGPHDSEEAARKALSDEHDVCGSCGSDDMEGREGYLCAECDEDDSE